MKRCLSLALLVALLVAPSPSVLAAQNALSPEDVVTQYFLHTKAGNYSQVAALFDPADLSGLRDYFVHVFALADNGVEGPSMIEAFFGPGATVEALMADNGTTAFVALMHFLHLFIEIDYVEFEVLGSVAEGSDLVHVVVRSTVSQVPPGMGHPVSMTQVEVASTKRVGGEWKVSASGELAALTQMLDAISQGM